MALALTNPKDKRRVNLISRAVAKSGGKLSAAHAVQLWLQSGSNSAFRAAVGLPRLSPSKAGIRFENLVQKTAPGKMQKIKREVAKAFAQFGGAAYAPKKRHPASKRKTTYAGRVLSTHARRYLSAQKKTYVMKKMPQNGPNGKFMKDSVTMRKVRVLDRGGIKGWNATRQSRRAAGEWGHTFPTGMLERQIAKKRYARGQHVAFPHGRGGQRASQPMLPDQVRRAQSMVGRSNPGCGPLGCGEYGALALENPTFAGALPFITGYAVPVMIAGGAAGALHGLAANYGVTGKLSEVVGKIPVVGEFVAERLPYTLQGALVGSALALAAGMVGGEAGKYLALAAGGVLVFGGGIDAYNALQGCCGGEAEESLNGLALENMGGLALENMGALALENMGGLAMDNPPFRGASLTVEDYGQASLADAFYSGADFSGDEGQALLNGKQQFQKRFGAAPRRVSKTVNDQGPSHLAGREGHRWGWLIKAVGWENAQKITAMQPQDRVKLLAKLRQASVAAANELLAAAKHYEGVVKLSEVAPEFMAPPSSAGHAPEGARGAQGITGPQDFSYLGDPAVFTGA